MSADLSKMTPCGACGMPCDPAEYHPYAACLMFQACHSSDTVRANLEAIRQEAARQAMDRTLSICRQMEERGYDAKDCAEAIEDAIRALTHESEKRQ